MTEQAKEKAVAVRFINERTENESVQAVEWSNGNRTEVRTTKDGIICQIEKAR